jgi:hypothetical protein
LSCKNCNPSTQEVEAGRGFSGLHSEFGDSLGYKVRLCLKIIIVVVVVVMIIIRWRVGGRLSVKPGHNFDNC